MKRINYVNNYNNNYIHKAVIGLIILIKRQFTIDSSFNNDMNYN